MMENRSIAYTKQDQNATKNTIPKTKKGDSQIIKAKLDGKVGG